MIELFFPRALVVFLFGYQIICLYGCSVIHWKRDDPVRNMRIIRTAMKVKTPGKTVSAVLSVGILDGKLIRLDVTDPFGVTHASVSIDARYLEVFDLNARCKRSYRNWSAGLTTIWGVPITFDQLTRWIFPEEWPRSPVVFRVERSSHNYLEVRQFPSSPGNNARVEVEVPDRGITIVMNWLNNSSQELVRPSIDGRMEKWEQCEDLNKILH